MKTDILKKIVAIAFILISLQSYSQTFVRKSIKSFNNTTTTAFGMAAIDYDSDGLLDIFNVDLTTEDRLFHNEGNGEFKLISIENGGFDGGTRDCGLTWGDFDNDGDPDPFIGTQEGVNHFFRNDGKDGFTRITEGLIATDTLHSFDAVWVDYDNDGWLDLFTCNVLKFGAGKRSGTPNYIFHNNGDGTFKKIENNIISADNGNNITGSFADYDNDGDQDLFVPDMGGNNYFYTNNGNSTFTKVTNGDIVEDENNSLSGAWADYDNDGDLDIFVVNGLYAEKDALYKNNGDGTFTRIFEGPLVNIPAVAWNAAWGDIDNDGDEDLYVSTWGDKNLFYINNGDGTFTQNNTNPIVSESDSTNTAVSLWGDFDNDGDLDFITADFASTRNIYYENLGNNNHWITIKLKATSSNRSAIGAQVRIKATINGKEVIQMREISASNGFRSMSNGFRAHFGLGDADKIESIEVRWPSGKRSIVTDVKTNQFLTITE